MKSDFSPFCTEFESMHQVNEYCMVLCLPQINTIGSFHFPLFLNHDVIKHVTTVKKLLKCYGC